MMHTLLCHVQHKGLEEYILINKGKNKYPGLGRLGEEGPLTSTVFEMRELQQLGYHFFHDM